MNLVSGFINVGQSITNWGSNILKRICYKELRNTHEGININESNQTDQNALLIENYKRAFEFFRGRTLHIEVLRDNKIYMLYFPKLPRCDYLTSDMILDFSEKVDRSNINSKVTYLQERSLVLID